MAGGMGGQQELVKDGYEITIQILCFVDVNLTWLRKYGISVL